MTRSPPSEGQENININPEIYINFEENSPFQEGVISETYQRPDKSFFKEPQELQIIVNTGNLVQNFLTTQADIIKIFKIIQKGTQRYTLTCHNKRNTGRIPSQSILQTHLSVSSTE